MLNIIFFISHLFINVINDYIAQTINLFPLQIIFFRFLFATIILIPFIYQNHKTQNLKLHISRGLLLLIGLLCWIYGLKKVYLSSAIAIGFMIPIFLLILEHLFLKPQSISFSKIVCIFIGFIGIILAIHNGKYIFSFTLIIFIIATLCFSLLDILTKKTADESITINAFYIYLTITITLIPYILFNYQQISLNNILLCALLGTNSNLIIYFITYAYRYQNPSFYGPYRYIEILFSFIIQYSLTNTLPTTINCVGITIIIITVYIHTIYHKS